MRKFLPPDWIIYAIILGVILFKAYGTNNDIAPLEPPDLGAALPSVRPSDPTILVDIEKPRSGAGTAFAVDRKGRWLTARHVVDSCTEVGLVTGPGRAVKVDKVDVSKDSDTAILQTRWRRKPLAFDLNSVRHIKETGFFFGFPQGQPGEVAGSLIGRHQLITRGRYNVEEAVLAWAERGRTRGLVGSLGGLSGGPVFDADGEVIGVVAAESPRRGRVYTVAPSSLRSMVTDDDKISPDDISVTNFGSEADRYRRDRRIAQVVCLVEK